MMRAPLDPAASDALPSDADLVAAARGHEAWACEALFRRHADSANALAYRLLGRDDELDDVVQDAYLVVLGSLDRLKDPQAFAAFLATVIVRRVRRLLRRRRLARALGLMPAREAADPTTSMTHAASADVVLELRTLYRAVGRLPTDERLALLLRRVEGLPLDEIANLCGCSIATVKRRIAAAERRLAAWEAPADERRVSAPDDHSPLTSHMAERRTP